MKVVEIERPELHAGEVMVKIAYVGFCGSDLNTYLGRNPMVKLPVIPGHEVGAVIEAVGDGVPDTLKPGMNVTVNPYTNCGHCASCRNGRVNAAMNLVRIRDLKNGGPSGDNDDSTDLRTFSIGYTYDASDTTSFYGMVAHTDYDSDALHGYRRNDTENDSITGFQVGVTHRF